MQLFEIRSPLRTAPAKVEHIEVITLLESYWLVFLLNLQKFNVAGGPRIYFNQVIIRDLRIAAAGTLPFTKLINAICNSNSG